MEQLGSGTEGPGPPLCTATWLVSGREVTRRWSVHPRSEVPGKLGAAPQTAPSSPGRGAGWSSSGVRVSGAAVHPELFPETRCSHGQTSGCMLTVPSRFSLQDAGIGFILVIDRRQDRWTSVKASILRIAVSVSCCRARDLHAFSGQGTWPFLPSGTLGPSWGCIHGGAQGRGGLQLGPGQGQRTPPWAPRAARARVCVHVHMCACVYKHVCALTNVH